MKYGKAALETLRELVEIPTFNVDGLPQYKNPEFLKIAAKIEALAKSFNLNFRNVDNRVYEISLEGSGDEVVGVHAHADVVPVTPENWVLQDGTKLDPFRVTLIGDRMYGRGTEDDKNGIVVTMYAMKVIKEENCHWRARSSCWWTPPKRLPVRLFLTISNAIPCRNTTWRWMAVTRW